MDGQPQGVLEEDRKKKANSINAKLQIVQIGKCTVTVHAVSVGLAVAADLFHRCFRVAVVYIRGVWIGEGTQYVYIMLYS